MSIIRLNELARTMSQAHASLRMFLISRRLSKREVNMVMATAADRSRRMDWIVWNLIDDEMSGPDVTHTRDLFRNYTEARENLTALIDHSPGTFAPGESTTVGTFGDEEDEPPALLLAAHRALDLPPTERQTKNLRELVVMAGLAHPMKADEYTDEQVINIVELICEPDDDADDQMPHRLRLATIGRILARAIAARAEGQIAPSWTMVRKILIETVPELQLYAKDNDMKDPPWFSDSYLDEFDRLIARA